MRSHAALTRRLRLRLWVLGVVAVAVGAAVAALIWGSFPSDYITNPRDLMAFGRLMYGTVGGWALLAAGLAVWARRPDNRVGALMVAVAYVWLLTGTVFANAPVLFSLGAAFGNVYIAVTAHLLLAFPSGRLQGRADRVIVAGSYLATLVLVPVAFLFADPVRFSCGDCPPNAFLVTDEKALAAVLFFAASLVLAGVGVALMASLLRRWRRATPDQRRPLSWKPMYAAAALTSVVFAVATVTPVAGFTSDLSLVVGLVAFLPLAIAVSSGHDLSPKPEELLIRDGAFDELLASLRGSPAPGPLREATARALGDPSLELAYWLPYSVWLPYSERYVDAQGKAVAVNEGRPGRAISEVRLEGQPVAAILHRWTSRPRAVGDSSRAGRAPEAIPRRA